MADPITVTLDGPGSIRVEWGDRYATHLTRDEALWVVATILAESGLPAWMRTKDEYDAVDAARAAALKLIEERSADPDFEVKGGAS